MAKTKNIETLLSEIHHDFDLDYVKSQKKKTSKLFTSLVNNVNLLNFDSILELSKDSSKKLIFAFDHVSELDYVLKLISFIDANEKDPSINIPKIIGGDNLLIKNITKKGILNPIIADMKKYGSITVHRNEIENMNRKYILGFRNYLRNSLINSDDNLLFYTSNGRSYDGSYSEMKRGILDTIIDSPQNGKDLIIIPGSITFDRVVEDYIFPKLSDLKSSNSPFKKTRLVLSDLNSFRRYLKKEHKGDAYINFGSPILTEDISSNHPKEKTKYKDRIADSIFSCQKNLKVLTSTSLVSSAIVATDYKNKGGVFPISLMYSNMKFILDNLLPSTKVSNELKPFINSNYDFSSLEDISQHAFKILNTGRKVETVKPFGATSYYITNKHLLNYYSNQAENIINKK